MSGGGTTVSFPSLPLLSSSRTYLLTFSSLPHVVSQSPRQPLYFFSVCPWSVYVKRPRRDWCTVLTFDTWSVHIFYCHRAPLNGHAGFADGVEAVWSYIAFLGDLQVTTPGITKHASTVLLPFSWTSSYLLRTCLEIMVRSMHRPRLFQSFWISALDANPTTSWLRAI